MWNMIAILFLGTLSAYLLYWGRAWFKHAHKEAQRSMKVSQRLAEQTALTAALAERARIAMNDLEEVGMADASALFEDIISDDQALRAEYNKQYGKLRNMVNKRG